MKKKFLIIWIFFIFNYNFILAEIPQNYFKGKFYKSVQNYFLVATKKMMDPRFKETVIVMLENDENGAWGLVINRPMGSVPLSMLIDTSTDTINKKKHLYDIQIPIFWGGPVNLEKIYVLHSNDYKNENTINFKDVSITRDYNILFDIAEKKGPKKNLVILGYSGWGSGQLEGEMEKNHWHLSELDIDLIFNNKILDKWLKVYKTSFINL